MTRDYAVTIKVRNNRLLEKMRSEGYETAAALSRDCGVRMQAIGTYLNLKKAPLLKDGSWSVMLIRLANHLRCLPEDLFPAVHISKPLAQNTSEFKADASDIHQISASLRALALPADEKMMITESKKTLDNLLNSLPACERRIIEERFGLIDGVEKSYLEVGEIASGPLGGKTRERIRQLEARALRRLRRYVAFNNLHRESLTQ